MASRDERIETYYHQSAWDLAERVVDLEDEAEAVASVEGDRLAALEARDAEIERLTSLVGYWEHRAEEVDRADRFEAAWKSARRRASLATGAWRSARHTAESWRRASRSAGRTLAEVLGVLSTRASERDRYRLAWLSARRRAADEANYATEALELKEREVTRWRSGHETAEAQLVSERRENARLRAFVKDVTAVRGWTMCAATPRDLLESHLRPIYDSMYELEDAEREGRPFVDRVHRRAARGEFSDGVG